MQFEHKASRWMIRLLLTLDKASPSNCLEYLLPFKVPITGANLVVDNRRENTPLIMPNVTSIKYLSHD